MPGGAAKFSPGSIGFLRSYPLDANVIPDHLRPLPTIAGDLVVAFGESAFNAFDRGRSNEAIWQCKVFDDNISRSGTPVWFGPFLYYVGTELTRLNQISLSSGIRKVCALVGEDGNKIFELPGKPIEACSPLLLRFPIGASPFATRTAPEAMTHIPVLVVFTTRGLSFVDLSTAPDRGQDDPQCLPTFRYWFWELPLAQDITQPVFAERYSHNDDGTGHLNFRYLFATGSRPPRLMVFDMGCFPNIEAMQCIVVDDTYSRFHEEFKKLKGTRFSPCVVAPKGRENDTLVYWLAESVIKETLGEIKAIRFIPPGNLRVSSLPTTNSRGQTWIFDKYLVPQLSDGIGIIAGRAAGTSFILKDVGPDAGLTGNRSEAQCEVQLDVSVKLSSVSVVPGGTVLVGGYEGLNALALFGGEANTVASPPKDDPIAPPIVGQWGAVLQTSKQLRLFYSRGFPV
ncbi:MAG: hypothetical protein WA705_18580 [Candidatus Ozemobacteraceae bacterium]